jgi:hypothetical protein
VEQLAGRAFTQLEYGRDERHFVSQAGKTAALFLDSDRVRPIRKIAGFIEPHRVAFVAPLVLKKFGFTLRRSDGLKTQSADRIV